jgi:DNA-binding NarL/FixJ family response regulator
VITLAILHTHQIFIDALRFMFQDQVEFNLVGSAKTTAEGMNLLERTAPFVVLMEYGLPGGSSLDLIANIKKCSPGTNIILMATSLDDSILIRAVNYGANGYFCMKDCLDDLLDMVRKVANGDIAIPSSLLLRMLRRVPRDKAVMGDLDQPWERLTAREIEILSCLAQGKTGKDISEELNIAPLTVRTHIRNLMTKVGAHSRLEAVSFGLRHGLISA